MASSEADLQFLVTDVMNIKLTDAVALSLAEAYVKSFDDVRTMAIDDRQCVLSCLHKNWL